MLLLRYIISLLHISMQIDTAMNTTVYRNMIESPRPNHAVSEKGMYMLRKTTAKSTEKVTVPIS